MRKYLKNFEFTEEFILNCIIECLSHKTNKIVRYYRKDTSYFLAEYYIKANFSTSKDMHEVASFVRKDIKDNLSFYEDVLFPFIAKELLSEIKDRRVRLRPIVYQKRMDSSSKKERDIGITSIKQQVYDYVCVNALMPMFNAKIGYYQCSSIKGRGQKYAKQAIERHIRKKYEQARYGGKTDIKKCYQSIQHYILFRLLERDIDNKDVLYLVETLVSTYSDTGTGLCIGTYLSQYLANYFLSYAYHFITEKAFKTRKSKTGTKKVRLLSLVVFYMDDIVMFSQNKKYLKMAMKMLRTYLKNELQLEFKNDTYNIIDLFKKGAFIDVVGYRFYKDHTTIRRRIYKRIKKDVKIINTYKENTDVKICRSFMSRHGFVKNSDSAKFEKKNKYDNAFRIASKVVSDETKNNLHR